MLGKFFKSLGKKRSGYDASKRGRLMLKWNPGGAGANSVLINGLSEIRNRSRDLARNNAWVTAALDSLVANITDPAITPISRAPEPDFRREVKKLWDEWGYEADAHGVMSWDLLVGLAFRSFIESGEVFLRKRPRRAEDGLVVPLQYQIIEADHCPIEHSITPANTNNRVHAGIEFDPLGRRVAYWMYPEHPGEILQQNNLTMVPVRIPASEIIHIFDPLRPGQIRGVPKLVGAIKRIYDLHEYEDAELVKKKMSSMFLGAIQSPAVDTDPFDSEEGLDAQPNVNWANLEPGTMLSLESGEEMKFNDPPTADASYEPHMKNQLRALAAQMSVTYEQMTGDLTGVNFSSIRAGLNEFQRRARRMQRLLIHQLCQPVWDEWLDQAVLSGAITAKDYVGRRREWARVEWRGPGWKYVNPQQEISAIKEEIKAGLNSRQSVLAEKGMDAAEIDEQIMEDKARADSLGLVFDTEVKEQATKPTNTING